MAEYIDRIELLIDLGFSYDDIAPTTEELIGLIKRQPAVDVESVVHGEWIKVRFNEPDPHERLRFRCSVCGVLESDEYMYCHCGAKMDRGE